MTEVAFLGRGLNSGTWSPLEAVLDRSGISWERLGGHEELEDRFAAVVVLGYPRLIPKESLDLPPQGVIVFHSSDLPRGRGWAPLFYTITLGLPSLTQTMFYAVPEMDAGPVIAKARFPIDSRLTETDLRRIDDRLTVELFTRYGPSLMRRRASATPQDDESATFWPRRRPEQSRIDPGLSLGEAYDFARALPENIPPFFYKDGVRVEVRFGPERTFHFDPDKIVILDHTGFRSVEADE